MLLLSAAAGGLGNALLCTKALPASHMGGPEAYPNWRLLSSPRPKPARGRYSGLLSSGGEVQLLCLLVPFVEVGGQFRTFLQLLRSLYLPLVRAF